VITRKTIISVFAGPIFTIFSPNDRHLYVNDGAGPFFPIPQRTLPWQPIVWQNLDIWVHSAERRSETDYCITILIKKI